MGEWPAGGLDIGCVRGDDRECRGMRARGKRERERGRGRGREGGREGERERERVRERERERIKGMREDPNCRVSMGAIRRIR